MAASRVPLCELQRWQPIETWETCQVCEGRREIEIEVEPITMEDLK